MRGVTDLAEWLIEQYDADEQLAREQDLSRAGEPYSDDSGIADRDGFPSYPWGAEEQELRFMAGVGHPTFVLADLVAKRRIVEMHRGAHECPTEDSSCGWCVHGDECETLQALALPYADREGYDPAWRPE